MTLEEKLLLIKDLSARLPYAVKVEHTSGLSGTLHNITVHHMYDENDHVYDAVCYTDFFGDGDDIYIEYFKPYLFPISSMTEEQKAELEQIKNSGDAPYYHDINDFFLKHHLDNRHLIEKGLAIDATGLNVY